MALTPQNYAPEEDSKSQPRNKLAHGCFTKLTIQFEVEEHKAAAKRGRQIEFIELIEGILASH